MLCALNFNSPIQQFSIGAGYISRNYENRKCNEKIGDYPPQAFDFGTDERVEFLHTITDKQTEPEMDTETHIQAHILYVEPSTNAEPDADADAEAEAEATVAAANKIKGKGRSKGKGTVGATYHSIVLVDISWNLCVGVLLKQDELNINQLRNMKTDNESTQK